MSKIDKHTIREFNLKRYMGKWYEIARFNHRFERGLQGVTAEYSFREDGKVRVQNCGYKGLLNGKKTCITGKARPSKNGCQGQLEVSFFPFLYSDYNILELDPGYEWALIGSSADKYLWILSRTPHLSTHTLNHILEKAQNRGYDTSGLIYIRQPET